MAGATDTLYGYRVFTQKSNTFKNVYFGMTTRKYDLFDRGAVKICVELYSDTMCVLSVIQRHDVRPFCHTADVACSPSLATLVRAYSPKQMQQPSKYVVSIRRCLLAKAPHTLNPYCVTITINHMVSDLRSHFIKGQFACPAL